jgi:TetR/AcrR family transcriptional repressor of nem operon
MRVSREQFLENREKILEAAARLFRERGFEEVGVADVMKAAGLTHGGFYGHFKSKDDLIAQATGGSAQALVERWDRIVEAEGQGALRTIARQYLGEAHLHAPGSGCQIAALGPEIARRSPEDRAGVTNGVKRLVEVLEKAAPGETPAERRMRALKAYAGWVGAVVLARISDDEAFSREVREAVAEEED